MKTPRQQWLDRVGVEFDPRTHAKLAEDLIAACPSKHTGELRRYLRDRLAFWTFALPPQDRDGPTIMAYNDLETHCQREHGVWLAVWMNPDETYRFEVCRRSPRKTSANGPSLPQDASVELNRPSTPSATPERLKSLF